MPPLRRAAIQLVTLAALLSAAATRAQETEPSLFFDRLDVRVVNLEVFVSDGKGRALTDLTKDDFIVFVDGGEVALSHFAGPSPPNDRLASAPVDTADMGGTDLPLLETEPLLVVVYVDNSNLLETRRDVLVRDLRKLAAEHGPGELRFMVVTWDGELVRRSAFSSDLAPVDRALAEIGAEPAQGVDLLREYRHAVADIQAIVRGFAETDCEPCLCGWDAMTGAWERYAHQTSARVGFTATGLLQLVRSLSGLPGRKAVVYLSSGLQQRPGVSLATYLADLCPLAENILEYQANRQVRYDETKMLAALSAEANAGRISLYPLQIEASGFDPGLTGFARLEREGNLRDGLRLLADETGGELSLKAARLFDRLESDVANGYELAFTPDHPADGEVHSIRVELRSPRRGIELRHRRTYRDKLLEERLVDHAHAVMSLSEDDAGMGNPLGVEALIRNSPSLRLELAIPTTGLTLLPVADTDGPPPPARVRVFLLIRDPAGRVLPARQKVIEVPTGTGPVHRVVMALDLPPGESDLVVGVRDEIGGSSSYLRLTTPSLP